MATMSANAPSDAIPADAKVRVTVEAANQPTSVTSKIGSEEKSGSKMDAAQSSLKQILSSLAETRKYLPNQVYTFLDSMEGKTIDDLRMEAMNLASKAQEEAKKRTGDVKNLVGNANQKVQDAADMARAKTTGIASDIANKGKDLVQPPLEATRDATKSVAMRSLEATQGLAMKSLEKSTNLAMQGFTMASTRLMPIVQPVVQPVASRAIEYLPAPAKTFVHENIEGKSLDELRDKALLVTRKNLLSVKDETKPATLSGLVGEVKEAAVSGKLLNNALTLSEKAANNAFGETETPADTAAWRRLYNLATKVTGGVKNYTTSQWNNLNAQWRLMASTRVNQMKGMVLYRVDMLRSNISPILERIGATPVIPSFVYKLLRGEVSPPQQMSSASSTEKSTADTSKATSATVPTTTVKVDIVGTKPFQAGDPADAKTASFGGTTTSIPLKEMNKSSEPIGNTNAQGMGELGSAGMGVTTTGSEDKNTSEGEEQKNKKKKHNKA